MVFFISLLLFHASHGKFKFKMHQISTWIEHRYATTEVGLWVENDSAEEETLELSYDLKRSEYINGLYGMIISFPEMWSTTGRLNFFLFLDQNFGLQNLDPKMDAKI